MTAPGSGTASEPADGTASGTAGQPASGAPGAATGATLRTVVIAGTANLVVMLAKLVAGVLTGSSAMLAEATHSFADTLNQVF
ncbi:MAG: cation transporter, partial [Streptosporangiales bacterium]